MGEINYKGKKIKSGDELILSFQQGKEFEAIAEVEDNTLFICSNNQRFCGSFPEEKHGKRYAFAITLDKRGRCTTLNADSEKALSLIKKGERRPIQISDEIRIFLEKTNENYLEYLYEENTFIDNYDRMNQPKDEAEALQGYVVLHSKERGKMLKIKLGRLVRKIITEKNKTLTKKIDVKDTDIETLHNNWVSHLNEVTFVLSKEKDIFNGYNTKNYAKKGSLSSCMNNSFDRLDFYTKNKNVGLMICYFKGEVCGRSLVWKCSDGKLYHDRIYIAFDWVRKSMLDHFAKENITNAYGSGLKLKVNLDFVPSTDSMYPYLDTFKIKNNKTKELTTY